MAELNGSIDEPDVEGDDDVVDENNGEFDDQGSIFERRTFAEKKSVFATPASAPADQRNPITTREADVQRFETVRPNPRPTRELVAKFDKDGVPWVAICVDGKQVEDARRPTPAELQRLDQSGKFLRGGIGDAINPVDATAKPAGLPWGKIAIGVAALAAVGGGIYYYKKHVASDDDELEEVED